MSDPVRYTLTITQKPSSSYLHAVVSGMNTEENVTRYLDEVRRACTDRGCRRVLIEERLEGPRLDTTGVFYVATHASARADGFFEAIAYVDVNAEGHLMEFAEIVASNRGLPVRVFSSVGAAEKWLLGLGDAS
jgi:hypothetical protein